MRCSNCKVPGIAHGLPTGVVPERIVCGNCGVVSDYHPSRYECIAQDYEGDLSAPFYMTPSYRTAPLSDPAEVPRCPNCKRRHNGSSFEDGSFCCVGCGETWAQRPPRNLRADWLKRAHTRQVLSILYAVRAHGGNSYDAGYSYSLEELKAELSTREHIPNKLEAKALRRARAQGKAE